MTIALTSGFIALTLFTGLDPTPTADEVARRVGQQWVTTYNVLDHLADGKATSPYLPARSPLYEKVDSARKVGTTVQNPWPGDGVNKHMHVRVRKTRVDRVMKDLRDCLVVPLVGKIEFPLLILPQSRLTFSPEYVRMGAAGVRMRVLVNDEELWSEVLSGKSLYKNQWDEVSLDLKKWGNQAVRLTFEVDKPSLGDKRWDKRGKHKGVGLFALPRVQTFVKASDVGQRGLIKGMVGDDMNHSVIMFVFDSLRADLLPPVREERKLIPSMSPNLDAHVGKAVQFRQAFSVGNQTRIGSYSFYLSTPPAAGGFFSIKWGLSDQFRDAFYAGNPVSLPRELKKAGYLTGHLGFNGFLTGFQYLSMDMGFDFVGEFNGVPENTVRMTDGIIEWLEAHKDEKFFLIVWFDPPHFPYNAPKSYTDKAIELGVEPDHKFFDKRYLGKMLYGDEYFGKIAAKLEELGLNKKTLTIVTADHGEAMDPRHEGYSKNVNTGITRHHGKSLYDEEMQVPLAIRLDGVLKPRVVSDQVSLMSLGPTILDLLGLPHKSDRRMGTTFKDLVRGGKEAVERLIYAEARWSNAIRLGGYKYIFHGSREQLKINREELWQRGRDGHDELLHVAKDPFELTNVAQERPEVLKKMRKAYFDWRATMRAFRRRHSKEPFLRPIQDLGMTP